MREKELEEGRALRRCVIIGHSATDKFWHVSGNQRGSQPPEIVSGSQERPSASGVRMCREQALRAREEAAILRIGTVKMYLQETQAQHMSWQSERNLPQVSKGPHPRQAATQVMMSVYPG